MSRVEKFGKQAETTLVYSTADVFISALLVGLTCFPTYLYHLFWFKPERIRNKHQEQGIHGPTPSFFSGNIPDVRKIHLEMAQRRAQDGGNTDRAAHDYISRLLPHIEKWRNDYGR